MKIILIAMIAAFTASLVLILILLPLLKKLKAGQYILGYVKEHMSKSGTPTMGGLAFVTAIVAVGLAASKLHDGKINLTLAITCGFMVIGFLDDFLKIYRKENEGLKPYQKILFQIAISVIAAVYCYINHMTRLYIPLSGSKSFDISWGIIPLVILIFIATVNCVNLTDGLDGLGGGTSLAYLIMLGIILCSSQNTMGIICFIGVAAISAFLLFNVNKASIFMGDTGSLALGGLISCLSVLSGNSLYIPILGIMFVLSGISVIIQVIYYKRTRRRIFLMAPLHHHFQMKGYTECKITYAYVLVTVFVGVICLVFM